MYKELNPGVAAQDQHQRLRHRLPRSRPDRHRPLAGSRLTGEHQLGRSARRKQQCGYANHRAGADHRQHRRLRSGRSPARTALRRRRHRLGKEARRSRACTEGEHLENQIELAPRAPILAADGTPLAEGPAEARAHPIGSEAIDVTGEVGAAEEDEVEALARQGFAPETPVGITGLERAFNARLAGKPGGSLLAVSDIDGSTRTLAEAKPKPGAPVKTTIDTGLQESAVAALAGRVGGIAVLDARNGDIRALAGQAFSAPQPPGSTFKMITTAAALQKGVVSLDDEFEITSGANVGGRFIENANGELCGGTFRQAFAESCNADFAPLGPKIGNDELVEMAERFGFNSPPTLYAPRIIAHVEPGGIDDPDRNRRRSRPRRQRDRPGRGAGDAAGDGERGADDRQRRRARADLDRRQLEAAARTPSRCG